MSSLILLKTLFTIKAVLPPDEGSAAKDLFDAVVNGNWWLVAGLGVWLMVTLVRKYGPALPFLAKFFEASWSGPLLAAMFAAAGALITALMAGEGFSLKLLFAVLGAAASAVFTQEVQQKAREAAGSINTAEQADSYFQGKK